MMHLQLRAEGIRTLAESLGLRVFPCQPGTKLPAVTHGFRSSPDDVKEAFDKLATYNLALVAGAESGGVVGIDCETEEVAKALFPKFDQLLASTWVIRTPHGGVVIIVRATDQAPERRLRLAGEAHPFDLCGEGGYFLIYGEIDHSKCDPAKSRCPHNRVTGYETISPDYQIKGLERIEESLLKRCAELGWETNGRKWPRIHDVAQGVREGERNRAAFVMSRSLLFTLQFSEADALVALRLWNARNKPPLHDDELEAVLVSARKGDGGPKKPSKKERRRGSSPRREVQPSARREVSG